MKPQEIIYHNPTEFPIPEGTDPVDCLDITLSQALGILSVLVNSKGEVEGNGWSSPGYAVWAVENLILQARALVDYWHKMEQENK